MHDEIHLEISRADTHLRRDYAFLNKQMKCLLVCFSACEWRSGSDSLSVKGVFVLHRSLTHPRLKDWSYAV